jgi:hypothetical protein
MTAPASSPVVDRHAAGRRWPAVSLWAVMLVLTIVGDVILAAHRVRSPSTFWDIGPSVLWLRRGEAAR